jgi:hypothetical protein
VETLVSPVDLLKSISLADINKRLAEIRAEEAALVSLARSLRARDDRLLRAAQRERQATGSDACK